MFERLAAVMSGSGLVPTLGLMLVALLLIGVNAFFVAAELSIVRVRRTRLEELSSQGVAAARLALRCVDQLPAVLATSQLGVTMASLGVGWIGEDAFAHLLALIFPRAFASGATLHVVAAGLAFAVVTFMHVVLGEIVPKNMAIDRAEAIALLVARPLWALRRLLRPLIWTFMGISDAVLRWMGHERREAVPLSEEELKLVVKESHQGGVVTATEAQIIHRAFTFADNTAADVMIPADRVDYLSLARSVDENVAIATRSQHTRLPLCRGGLDSVLGIVNMKDAWPLLAAQRSNRAFERARRPVIWLAPTTPQDQILKHFQRGKAQIACVRSGRQGRIVGLITIEEVLETLLGDLREARKSRV